MTKFFSRFAVWLMLTLTLTITACGSPQPAEAAAKAQSIDFLLSQVRTSVGALPGGKVWAYADGTSTLKTIWLDRGKQTQAANPYTLDSNATAQLYGDGLYRIVIKDAAGGTKFDREGQSFKDKSNDAYDVSDYASLAAAVASIGSTPATLEYATDPTLAANLTIPATLELMPLNGAKINHSTYTISYAGSTARWPISQIFSGTGLVSLTGTVYPEFFGAKGDGSTDNYTPFSRLSATINAGGVTRAVFRGTYLVDQYRTAANALANPIRIVGVSGLELDGYGAKIAIKGNFNRAINTDEQFIGIFLIDSKRVKISGFELDGNNGSLTRLAELFGTAQGGSTTTSLVAATSQFQTGAAAPVGYTVRITSGPDSGLTRLVTASVSATTLTVAAFPNSMAGQTYEVYAIVLEGTGYGHGIHIQSCDQVSMTDLYVHNFQADGIYIRDSGTTTNPRLASTNITGTNIISRYNSRQGMSIIQLRGGVFTNCEFSYTGRDASHGAISPAAGMDLEPNRDITTASPNQMDQNTGDVTFVNCRFLENAGGTVVVADYNQSDSVSFLDCRFVVGGGGSAGTDALILDVPNGKIVRGYIDVGDGVFYAGFATNTVSSLSVIDTEIVADSDGTALRSLYNIPLTVQNCRFTSRATAAAASGSVRFMNVANTKAKFTDNDVFLPAALYLDGGSGDRHIIINMDSAVSRNNKYTTDLLAAAGSGGTAHYSGSYGTATVVEDSYAGVAPGTADTFRPVFNGLDDTRIPYRKNLSLARVSADQDDLPKTLTVGSSENTMVWATPLTVDRAVTLSAVNAVSGSKFRIVRKFSATGAYSLNIGAGPLKALASEGTWCEVEYDGTAWALTAYGAL